jgi:Zn-dependent peptidase ImmA (M78 family)
VAAKLRHGFKTEAKRIALAERRDLDISPFDPLDPYHHAEKWGIKVYNLDSGVVSAEAVHHFSVVQPSKFSAMLVPDGTGHLIIENHTHDPLRRRSTIAHEMSHVILEHEFDILLGDGNACRSSASPVEAEAAELSGELLIPSDAALKVAKLGWTDQEVANHFQVSLKMAAWRMNGTGARKRAKRAAAFRRRPNS